MLLSNTRIAFFVADYYDDLEFWYPYYRMLEEDADITVIGPVMGLFTGKKGMQVQSDSSIERCKVDQYDALFIPGGFAPDYMRREPTMIDFVRKMNEQQKTIGAICHGPWLLASANIVRNRTFTSYHSIKDDLVNAGAYWIDQETVVDNNIITSRSVEDVPAFCKKFITMLSKQVESKEETT